MTFIRTLKQAGAQPAHQGARRLGGTCVRSSDQGSGMEPTESQGPYQPRTPPMAEDDPVVQWLLQGDPAIRRSTLDVAAAAPVANTVTTTTAAVTTPSR
jgi:hypothetical protein